MIMSLPGGQKALHAAGTRLSLIPGMVGPGERECTQAPIWHFLCPDPGALVFGEIDHSSPIQGLHKPPDKGYLDKSLQILL